MLEIKDGCSATFQNFSYRENFDTYTKKMRNLCCKNFLSETCFTYFRKILVMIVLVNAFSFLVSTR